MEQSAIDIVTVNATTFHTLTKQKGAMTTVIYVRNTEVMAKSTSTHPASETGINILPQYHEFLDVFSRSNITGISLARYAEVRTTFLQIRHRLQKK